MFFFLSAEFVSNLSYIFQIQDLLSDLSTQLKHSCMPNSIPAICSSLHNVLSYISAKVNSTKDCTFLQETDSEEEDLLPRLVEKSQVLKESTITEEDFQYFLKYFPVLQVPNIVSNVHEDGYSSVFEAANMDFMNNNTECLDFLGQNISFEDLLRLIINNDDTDKFLKSLETEKKIDVLELAQGMYSIYNCNCNVLSLYSSYVL